MALRDALLPEFDQEMAGTRKTLERVPDEKLAWKPHPKSWTMGELATHVASILQWTAMTIDQDSFDIAPPGGEPYKNPLAGSRAELLDMFEKGVAAARASLAGASDETLLKPWSLLKGGQPLMTMPRIAVVRTFILNHGIHHRAQLGVYLRLNDIPVPGLYGPSADEGTM
jgi:uncharacterized damage-inducible protein DinB